MGYEIEISCKLQIPSFQKVAIIEKAKNWGSELHYTQYDLEGRRKQIYNKRCIMTFIFPTHELQYSDHPFVQYIKARRGVYIESISTDNGGFELLYASPRYLTTMDKAKAKEYRDKLKQLKEAENIVCT